MLRLSDTLQTKDCFDDRAEYVLTNLSDVHKKFYELHGAIFDTVNWGKRSQLLNPQLYMYRAMTRAPKREMTPQEVDAVLAKLGL